MTSNILINLAQVLLITWTKDTLVWIGPSNISFGGNEYKTETFPFRINYLCTSANWRDFFRPQPVYASVGNDESGIGWNLTRGATQHMHSRWKSIKVDINYVLCVLNFIENYGYVSRGLPAPRVVLGQTLCTQDCILSKIMMEFSNITVTSLDCHGVSNRQTNHCLSTACSD